MQTGVPIINAVATLNTFLGNVILSVLVLLLGVRQFVWGTGAVFIAGLLFNGGEINESSANEG
jgi:hypothetical protein